MTAVSRKREIAFSVVRHRKGNDMERLLKVSYATGGALDVPMIRLQGIWLRSAGFGVSDIIRVEVVDLGHMLIRRLESVQQSIRQAVKAHPQGSPG